MKQVIRTVDPIHHNDCIYFNPLHYNLISVRNK